HNSLVAAAWDNHVDSSFHIRNLKGFGGSFLDCDEIEIFLLQRGVFIPAGMDLVGLEIDPSDFSWTPFESLSESNCFGSCHFVPLKPGFDESLHGGLLGGGGNTT